MDRTLEATIKELREGKTSPITIFEELYKNISKTDSTLRIYVTLNENAREEANKASELLKKPNPPMLAGIPLSVKDLIETRGIATTYGNSHFSSNVPEEDAELIRRLKNAGAYVLGKTNTHEFALGMESAPTANPWDTERIPGGSSGGSAAAVAAGSAIFAIGSDTGGSIRIPSSMCGVTGLKPTYGSISTEGVFPESWSLDHLGPITRYASDIPLMMRVMGRDIGSAELTKPLKAAVLTEYMEESDPGVRKAVQEAIDLMVNEGLVETFDLSADLLNTALSYHEIIDTSEIATVHKDLYPEHPEIYLPTSVEQIEAGRSRTGPEYVEAVRQRDILYSQFEKSLNGASLVLAPTMGKTAPLKSQMKTMTLAEHEPYVKFQASFNYLGNPALSMPCGFSNGLPVGLQVIGRRNFDAEAVSMAIEFQKITDYHLKHPGHN